MRRDLSARKGPLPELEARPARSEVLFELKELLHVAREALREGIAPPLGTAGKALTLSLLKRQNAQRLEQIDRKLATVEAAILQHCRSKRGLGPIASPS